MENDDRYVLRHEWERGQGKTYEKINEVDRKHTESIAALNNKVDRQTVLQEKAFESQTRSEKHLEKISESMGNMGKRVNDLEYETKTNMKELSTVKQDIDTKKTGNTQIIVAWIGILGPVIVAAIGLAQLFFR